MVFGAAGAAQTPKLDDFWPAQKPCIKNPGVTPCRDRFRYGHQTTDI
jgi:hypothetical protein